MQRLLRPSLLGLMLLASGRAQALSIGDIEVRSHLGEPLDARIPVSLDEVALPQVECFRLTRASLHHPDLANARVSLVAASGRRHVAIIGSQPVNDPVLDIGLITEGCGPSLQRDFVVLLSPKEVPDVATGAIRPPVIVAPTAMAEPAPPTPARKKRPRKAVVEPPRPPAAAYRKPPTLTVTRHVLRLDYGFDAFSLAAERIAKERQAAHLAGQARRPATGAMEQDVLVLQDAATEPGAAATAGQSSQGVPAGTPSAGTGSTATNAKGAGLPAAPKPVVPAERSFRQFFTPLNLLFLLLLPLLAIVLALWLKSRARTETYLETDDDYANDDQVGHQALIDQVPTVPITRTNPPETAGVPVKGQAAEPAPAESKEPAPVDADMSMEFHSADDYSVEATETPDHVLELAEVMLAFGRSSQAIETLRYYIRNSPLQGVDPWLKLLDLYRQSELRTEFDSLSMELHQCFNVAVPEWDSYAAGQDGTATAETLSLESLPHIMGKLISIWDKPESLNYLEKLLADNRGGQRLGFALPIVREILLLRDILRVTSQPAA